MPDGIDVPNAPVVAERSDLVQDALAFLLRREECSAAVEGDQRARRLRTRSAGRGQRGFDCGIRRRWTLRNSSGVGKGIDKSVVRAAGTYISAADSEKPSDASHRWRRTRAMASTVGDGLAYQAAVQPRVVVAAAGPPGWQEKSPIRIGVVRAMARSDHWRWVSTPR